MSNDELDNRIHMLTSQREKLEEQLAASQRELEIIEARLKKVSIGSADHGFKDEPLIDTTGFNSDDVDCDQRAS